MQSLPVTLGTDASRPTEKTSGAVPSYSRNGPHAVPLTEPPLRQKTSRSTVDTTIWLLQEMGSQRLPQKHKMSVRQAACQLMMDYSWALKWMRQFRRKGNVQPKRQGGYRKSVLLPHTRWILQYIEQKPDETLGEIRQSLIQKGVWVRIATLWRFFQRHQISFKKRGCVPKNRIERRLHKHVLVGRTIKGKSQQGN